MDGPLLNMERYGRQIMLPGVGVDGQRKIRAAGVFIVGAGGLGSAAAYYLCAAGVGKLGIIDHDRVEVGNLQRQILHHAGRIGAPKALSAAQTLRDLNPEVEVAPHQRRLTEENARKLLEGYDLVVDCSDNFFTRYILNDACVRARMPLIYGAVQGFEGQAMTVVPGEGPCYRCLYPGPPPDPGAEPAGLRRGVIGVVPGVIGLVQASEALKLILGRGELLTGRILLYNMLAMEFSRIRVVRSAGCPDCGRLIK
ncbi:MAG: HesA/MoeB/ThiF family protein [Bacillota bacterium]